MKNENVDYQSHIPSFDENKKQKYWIGGYVVLAFVFLAIHFLLELKVFSVWDEYLPMIKRLSLSIFFIFIILLISYPVRPLETTSRRTSILKLALQKLQAHPDKAQFPEGTAR